MKAFALADKYQTHGGWSPELVAVHLKSDGMNGQAEKLLQKYLRTK